MNQEPLTWSERHLDLYALPFKKTYSSRLKQPAQTSRIVIKTAFTTHSSGEIKSD